MKAFIAAAADREDAAHVGKFHRNDRGGLDLQRGGAEQDFGLSQGWAVSDERAVRRFNTAFGSSRIARAAYQPWPTSNFHSQGDSS